VTAPATPSRGRPRVVGLSGHVSLPSRTEAITRLLVERLAAACGGAGVVHAVTAEPAALGATLARDQAPPVIDAILRDIEACDLLVAVTPVYKGSYAGLFKHLIDLLDRHALRDKPVVVVATGYTERHAGVVDHALRPLFAFFDAEVVSPGLFVGKADLDEAGKPQGPLAEAVDTVVARAVRALAVRTGA
jgi:FMN reductase